jgi:hypothetical protein
VFECRLVPNRLTPHKTPQGTTQDTTGHHTKHGKTPDEIWHSMAVTNVTVVDHNRLDPPLQLHDATRPKHAE